MATSGSTDFNLTGADIVDKALKMIGAVSAYQTANSVDTNDAYDTLNLMLKGWETHGPNIFRWKEGSETLVADTASYTLETDVVRISSIRYRDANSLDTPMFEISREEYYNLPNKTVQGIPTQWHFDALNASPLLYIWPVKASVTTEALKYTYQRRFEDVDAGSNDIDVAQEWLETVLYNLASRLADEHGKTGERIDRIVARAELLFMQAKSHGHEGAVQFMAGGW
jgi:hypothetical protein